MSPIMHLHAAAVSSYAVPQRTACCSGDHCLLHSQGRPIYVQHLGAINYKKMLEVTTEERMIRFHVQEYERCARIIMPACTIVAGRHIDQTFAIIDVKGEVASCGLAVLAGASLILLTGLQGGPEAPDGRGEEMLSKIMSIDQNNYPEMLGHTCIINAPGVFKMVWGAIKGFIDPKTQEKIEVRRVVTSGFALHHVG